MDFKNREKMEKEVTIKIKSCTECPHFKSERDYTADSFEMCFRWICTHHSNVTGPDNKKDIRRYVKWSDNKNFIPDWCPLTENKEKLDCGYYT